ncbi:MAG TPA: response regulator [Nitrospiraceae bacterium]
MKRVLVVDDEVDFTFFLKKNLETKADVQVSICNKADEAIEKAKAFKPDIILLDMVMPEMQGDDLAIALSADRATERIPIVFLTAIIQQEETSDSSNMIGGHYFVAKPVKIDELISVIANVTKGR